MNRPLRSLRELAKTKKSIDKSKLIGATLREWRTPPLSAQSSALRSPKDVVRRLGIAEESLSSWLDEREIQLRAMDNLLRIFFAFPPVRAVLSGTHDARLGTAELVGGS